MDDIKKIVGDIKAGNLKPVYFLMGEEAYYIDKIAGFIEDNVLDEAEKGFNQMVMYGKDVSVDDIVANAKRFPMMAERQVVIVKEAQHLSRSIEQLTGYVEQPQPSTVLVICYKYGKLDKRKKLYKAVNKNGLLYESKKLYDNQVADWMRRVLKGKGYGISPKSAAILVEYLGTDLSIISKQLDKLTLILEKGAEISPEVIENHIGISKDYNNFELKKAIGERDMARAARIITYFGQNPKDHPLVVTITLLNTFFTQLLQYHGMLDHNPQQVAKQLGVNPYFVGEFKVAARNYPMKRVSHIISSLRQLDLKGKGVGAQNVPQADLLKELLVSVF